MSSSDVITPAPQKSCSVEGESRADDGNCQIVERDLEKGPREELVLPRNKAGARNGARNDCRKGSPEVKRERTEVSKVGLKGLINPGIGETHYKPNPPDQAIAIIIRVFELSFDGTFEPITEFECVDEMRSLKKLEIETRLKSLPSQRAQTIRLYICDSEFILPNSPLLSHLGDIGLDNIGAPRVRDVSNISKLAGQWQEEKNMDWLGISPLDDDNWSAYMKCMPLDADKLVVIHSFLGGVSESNKKKWNDALLASFQESSCFRNLTQSRSEVARLLVLNFLQLEIQMSMDYANSVVDWIQEDYQLFGHTAVDYKAFESYNINNSRFERNLDQAQDSVDATEFVISSIIKFGSRTVGTGPCSDRTEISTPGKSPQLEQLFENIRGCCRQYTKLVTRREEYGRRRSDVFLSTLTIHESDSVKRLTVLAAGFLPLSLAASVLSMQTRFADLNYVIYDFVGVGALLFFLMGVVYGAVKLAIRAATWKPFGPLLLPREDLYFTPVEADILRHLKKRQTGLRIVLGTRNIVASLLAICVVASFLVGMFNKVSLGLRVLGYGIAAIVGLLVITFSMFLGLAELGRCKRPRKRNDHTSGDEAEE